MTRRRKGHLFPLETDLLWVAHERSRRGTPEFCGFDAAREIGGGAERVTNGSVYKALARLVDFGLFDRSWEDPDIGIAEGRPRRRLYRQHPSFHG